MAQVGQVRIEPVAGTDFGLAYARVAPVRSGPGIGSLIVGIASILVAGLEICLGLTGSVKGWGPLVAGAFAILAFVLGRARPSWPRRHGERSSERPGRSTAGASRSRD